MKIIDNKTYNSTKNKIETLSNELKLKDFSIERYQKKLSKLEKLLGAVDVGMLKKDIYKVIEECRIIITK